jgi:tetratricopeptide (TPR) repeat protein
MMTDTEMVVGTDQPKGLVLEGIRELSRGNEQAALEAFSRALAGADDPDTAALCAARLLMLRARFDEAGRTLESLAEERPGLAEARLLLGYVYRRQCRFFDAIHSFRAALHLEPGNAVAEAALHELLDVQEP